MKHIFFIIISLLTLSCSRDILRDTTVKGKVTDILTGEPIPNLNILILRHEFSLAGVGETSKVEEFRTDAEGRFEHSFSTKINSSYECTIDLSTPNIATGLGGAAYYAEDIEEGEDNTINFRTTFVGYIKENVVNISCDRNEILVVEKRNAVPEDIRNIDYTIGDCRSIISEEFKLSPMGLHTYTWCTLRDGVVLTENRDSFFLEIGERKEFTIEW